MASRSAGTARSGRPQPFHDRVWRGRGLPSPAALEPARRHGRRRPGTQFRSRKVDASRVQPRHTTASKSRMVVGEGLEQRRLRRQRHVVLVRVWAVFFTCARAGRSKGAMGKVSDALVSTWARKRAGCRAAPRWRPTVVIVETQVAISGVVRPANTSDLWRTAEPCRARTNDRHLECR